MKRNFRFIWMLLKLKLSRTMVYRFNFFNAFFIDGLGFAVQLITFSAIYGNVDSIGDWGRAESLLFVGTFSLINALNMLIYFFGINSMAEKIQSGDLDAYLTKPFPTLMRLTFESIDLGSVPLVIFSIGIVVYAASGLKVPIVPANVVGYVVLVLLMTLLWYDMEVILRSIAFFTISIGGIEHLESTLIETCMRIPGIAFHGVFKFLFCLLLPYGIMGTVPVQMFIGALTPGGLVYALAIVVIFTALTFFLFRLGVKNYKSASS